MSYIQSDELNDLLVEEMNIHKQKEKLKEQLNDLLVEEMNIHKQKEKLKEQLNDLLVEEMNIHKKREINIIEIEKRNKYEKML